MKVTRVSFESPASDKALAICSVIMDDCLKLCGIKLYKNSEGYYWVLPSKQDVYQEIEGLNPSANIKYPSPISEKAGGKNFKYEEFFYPVKSDFYQNVLAVIIDGYKVFKKKGVRSYRP